MTRVISVNQRGALTLPKDVRDKVGVTRGGQIVVNVDESGAVSLSAGVVMPIEIYSPARVEEFERMNEKPLAGKKLTWCRAR